MSDHKLGAWGDILLSAVVICGTILLFVGAADLPPPRFEPLGSAAMPRILGVILCALSTVVAWQAVRRLLQGGPVAEVEGVKSDGAAASQLRSISVFVALVLYVAALDKLQADFVLATTCFVTAAGLAMTRFGWRQALVHAALGLTLALVIHAVFTRFLFIDLG